MKAKIRTIGKLGDRNNQVYSCIQGLPISPDDFFIGMPLRGCFWKILAHQY